MNIVHQRIDDLEARIAHQDRTIAELNEVVLSQWKKIEEIERKLHRLSEEVDTIHTSDAPPITRPPHY